MSPPDTDVTDHVNVVTQPPASDRETPNAYTSKFVNNDLDLTFTLLELQLESTNELARFRALLNILPVPVLQRLKDILPSLHSHNQPYTQLKSELLTLSLIHISEPTRLLSIS